jgi:signal transduction histidine kinase
VWRIWVADNGRGIAEADRERVFKIFQRLVPSSECEGTGIGLAVCKKIVENMGGRIWIDSVPGQGSTFQVSLPVD